MSQQQLLSKPDPEPVASSSAVPTPPSVSPADKTSPETTSTKQAPPAEQPAEDDGLLGLRSLVSRVRSATLSLLVLSVICTIVWMCTHESAARDYVVTDILATNVPLGLGGCVYTLVMCGAANTCKKLLDSHSTIVAGNHWINLRCLAMMPFQFLNLLYHAVWFVCERSPEALRPLDHAKGRTSATPDLVLRLAAFLHGYDPFAVLNAACIVLSVVAVSYVFVRMYWRLHTAHFTAAARQYTTFWYVYYTIVGVVFLLALEHIGMKAAPPYGAILPTIGFFLSGFGFYGEEIKECDRVKQEDRQDKQKEE